MESIHSKIWSLWRGIITFLVIDEITLRLFLTGAKFAYLKNMQLPRAWGAESPSRLPGKQNPRSGFGVTLAKLAFYVRTEIKSIIREVLLSKKHHEKHSLSAVSKELFG